MFIQVLGPGCAKCTKLATLTEEAAKRAGIDYTLEKVTEIDKIIGMGVITTPALFVDGQLKCSGTVPGVEQIVKILTEPQS